MRSIHLSRLAAAVLVLAATACSDSPAAPSVTPTSLTAALSEMTLSAYVPSTLGAGVPTPGIGLAAGSCTYSSATLSFSCPPVTSQGLTLTRSFQLLNDAGVPQSAFDAATTAAIRTTSTMTGNMTLRSDVIAVDHAETMTLSGLRTNTHVLDGTQQTHFTGTFGGYPLNETVMTTIAGLQIPADISGAYPKAGTITIVTNDAGSGSTPASSTSLTMTFSGTSIVGLTLTSGSFTQKCTLDLANPTAAGLVCS